MNFRHLIIVLAIMFDVVRNEAVPFESYLLELIAALTDMQNKHDMQLEMLPKDLYKPTPAFMASTPRKAHFIARNGTIQFSDESVNVNGCYNKFASVFTAPVSGTYYFALTLPGTHPTALDRSYHMGAEIVAGDGQRVLGLLHYDGKSICQMRNIHALAHLDAGENVWVKCTGLECVHGHYLTSTFLGFLVHV